MEPERIKAVILDGHTLNPGDLSWSAIQGLLDTSIYDFTLQNHLYNRCRDADFLIVNKTVLDKGLLESLPNLKAIFVTATGYNNVDVNAAKKLKIAVYHVKGYGTTAVAQHVFALILAFTNSIHNHHQSVVEGAWSASDHFSYTTRPVFELAGKTLGVWGYGAIGRKVCEIGNVFDMRVLVHTSQIDTVSQKAKCVTLEELFSQSDILTLHTQLKPGLEGIVNKDLLFQMKQTAILINTARGALINEVDLKSALLERRIAGAALDVLSEEPPKSGNILIGLPRCIITPHMAWASREARSRLMNETVRNVRRFISGDPTNRVV